MMQRKMHGPNSLTSTILIRSEREPPDVAKTDSKTNRREHEVHLVGPVASLFVLILAVFDIRLQQVKNPRAAVSQQAM